jgi:hypothetical protein
MDSNRHLIRVGLRLWGFYDFEVEGWLQGLPSSAAKASWEVVRNREGKELDMVLHLVRSTSASCGPFCWNCVGANRAMQRSIGSSTTHLALFFGDVRRLPVHRSGLWMLLDGCSERAALHTVAENVVIPLVSQARQAASAAYATEPLTYR